jgi:hypothetical protein
VLRKKGIGTIGFRVIEKEQGKCDNLGEPEAQAQAARGNTYTIPCKDAAVGGIAAVGPFLANYHRSRWALPGLLP